MNGVPDSAEVVCHGDDGGLLGHVDGVDVGAVGDFRPDAQRFEGEDAGMSS